MMEAEYPVLCIRCTKFIGFFNKPRLDAVFITCKAKETIKRDEVRRKRGLEEVDKKLMYSSFDYYRDE